MIGLLLTYELGGRDEEADVCRSRGVPGGRTGASSTASFMAAPLQDRSNTLNLRVRAVKGTQG